MSVHGNQYILPFYMSKEKEMPQIKMNEELTLAFYLLIKEMNDEEKIVSFSRLLWPFLSIQGVISTHIILDGLLLFSNKGKYSNPPRQPLVGHILRNVDNREKSEQLNRIIDILTYKDSEAEEIGESEESEFHTLEVEGLVNPNFLQGLMKLVPLIQNQPILDYVPLDTSLSTEKALTLSEKYRNIIEEMRGNALRWDTVSELIGKEVSKWITDITVQLKDIDSRYSSQITKTSSTIDSTQIKEQLEKERDKIDLWKVSEKKKVIENITLLFKSFERSLEDLLKKNRFFSREDSLKSKILEDLFPNFEQHLNFLKEEGRKFFETLESIEQQYIAMKASSTQIDIEAEEKLENIEVLLQSRLQDRDKLLSEIGMEKVEQIRRLKDIKEQYETLFSKISQILQKKKADCLNDAKSMIEWSIKDDSSELFAKPIQWIYMPIYVMFLEDEGMMEERMNLVLPGYISKNNIYEEICGGFHDLKLTICERVEDDMKIRSNFEFSCENKNLIEDPNFKKQIQKGTSVLRNHNIINGDIEKIIKDKINI